MRNNRVKGNPKLTPVHVFKKKPRGYSETVTLQDKSATVVRWNDNAPVTMVSSLLLGNLPERSCSRYNRKAKSYVEVPQPDIVKQYNLSMGWVDWFDQNNNHLRIKIWGKKWYWSILTWVIDTSLYNAWQLNRKASRVNSSMSYLEFRRNVVNVILRDGGRKVCMRNVGQFGDHEIRYADTKQLLIVRKNQRSRCALEGCTTKCQTYCDKCDRAICCDHFFDFHTKKDVNTMVFLINYFFFALLFISNVWN